jgi:hypothetical protein
VSARGLWESDKLNLWPCNPIFDYKKSVNLKRLTITGDKIMFDDRKLWTLFYIYCQR